MLWIIYGAQISKPGVAIEQLRPNTYESDPMIIHHPEESNY